MAMELKDYHDNQPDLLFEQFSRTPPVFSAPEMFTMKKRYSTAADIWSLGCIMHVLLTGKYPFWDEDEEILGAMACLENLDLENGPLYARLIVEST